MEEFGDGKHADGEKGNEAGGGGRRLAGGGAAVK